MVSLLEIHDTTLATEARVRVIAAEGLSAATMRNIAQQAGCTTGSLTHYFASRKDILRVTLQHVHRNAGTRMTSAMATASTADDALLAVLLESLPLDSVRFNEWRVWLAFWGVSMNDIDLSRENTRRYRQWSALIESLLEPIVPKARLSFESKRLIALVDGLGVGVARQRLGTQALANAQQECHAILRQHLKTVQVC